MPNVVLNSVLRGMPSRSGCGLGGRFPAFAGGGQVGKGAELLQGQCLADGLVARVDRAEQAVGEQEGTYAHADEGRSRPHDQRSAAPQQQDYDLRLGC